ncbi:MAG: hypothetical protein ACON4H_10470 [Rubripirellula sp.]
MSKHEEHLIIEKSRVQVQSLLATQSTNHGLGLRHQPAAVTLMAQRS